MIGIDTNVLLGFYEKDERGQAVLAEETIRENAPVFVSEVVLVEFAWVCRSRFKMSRSEIHARLEAVVNASEFEFARREMVERAVALYGSMKSDLADWLIGLGNLKDGCETTVTFDGGAKTMGGFSSLT